VTRLVAALAAIALGAPAVAARADGVDHHPLPTADAYPVGIAAGPDGALWVAEHEAGRLARVDTAGGVTELEVGVHPVEVVAAGGALWTTLGGDGAIARVTTAGEVEPHPLPAGAPPLALAAGPDSALWYTRSRFDGDGSAVGRMTLDGDVTEFALPGARPAGIVAGPDGNLWVTAPGTNEVVRVTPAGEATPFPLPAPDAGPRGIAAGPDGALWFAEAGAGRIGRITTAGDMAEFPLITAASTPTGIAAGPGGALWVTGFDGNQIARVTTDGRVEEFPPLERPASRPNRIAAGPDGAMWFTESGANAVGRIAPDAAPVPPPPSPPPPPPPPEPPKIELPDYQPRAFSLVARTTRATRGRARVLVHCPAVERESCRGRMVLETADAVATRLGRARFAVASGRTEAVVIRLRRAARRHLSRFRSLSVRATATTTDAAGNKREEDASFRLLAQRHARRTT
jgi:virginiamycin B lyase